MSCFASLAIVLQVTTALAGPTALAADRPHPAVVRVIAPEGDGIAYGSGTLVGINGPHGLVVTNWHVVRDATGKIEVVFADGFRSAANVLATDADWDLAALAIWRPAVEPVRLSAVTPRPGDALTIAGYGSGRYRTASGRCTQYVAPGRNLPFEMVELSVAARQGDSGGPIFNQRGELAGVLFGAARGTTTGSYCGRVKWFLAKVTDDFRDIPREPEMLAAAPPRAIETQQPTRTWPNQRLPEREEAESVEQARQSRPLTASIAAPAAEPGSDSVQAPAAEVATNGWTAAAPQDVGVLEPPALPATAGHVDEPPSRFDQIKTILAMIGVVALLFHGLRLLSSMSRV